MEQVPGLAATFLAHAKVRFASPDAATLDRLLTHRWRTCQAQWPTVQLPAEAFVRHVAERLPSASPDSSLESLLDQMSLGELFLACGCLRSIPAAIEAFDKHYLAKLPSQLRIPSQSDAMLEDVCQLTRVKLLVPTPEGAPRIGEYTGRGALLSWVRVTASRIAIKLQAAEKSSQQGDEDKVFDGLQAPGTGAELELIKRRYHSEFRQAMLQAFSALSSDERHLLRLYFVDQLSMYEMAALFRVNQGTISRWLKSARERVYEDTRNHLQSRLGLSPQDFKSFLAVLDSQLELSISQLLGEDDAPPRPTTQD